MLVNDVKQINILFFIYRNYFIFSIVFPGIPTTVLLSSISFKTTAFAPIFTLFPIFIGPRTFAPAPIITLFPKSGCLLYLSFPVPPKCAIMVNCAVISYCCCFPNDNSHSMVNK